MLVRDNLTVLPLMVEVMELAKFMPDVC
jgi:hypothetical protein